jgi:hypothetical protein
VGVVAQIRYINRCLTEQYTFDSEDYNNHVDPQITNTSFISYQSYDLPTT